jgi:AcrR family transcriptional regulator
MTARADAAAATARRVLDAAHSLFVEGPFDKLTLEAVADRAGVTLQTVLRRFGSKAALIAAVAARDTAAVEAQRFRAVPGDVAGAVSNLFDHYEEWADVALKLLAQEDRYAEVAGLTHGARATHARWVEHAFGPQLAKLRGRRRRMRRAQLVALCDVYFWKLLRRDLGLSRADAETALLEAVEALP